MVPDGYKIKLLAVLSIFEQKTDKVILFWQIRSQKSSKPSCVLLAAARVAFIGFVSADNL